MNSWKSKDELGTNATFRLFHMDIVPLTTKNGQVAATFLSYSACSTWTSCR